MQCDEREQVLTAFVKCYKRDAMLANKTRNAAPATNADRIRAMTDEELAVYFADMAREDIYDDPGAWLVWLQKPTERG